MILETIPAVQGLSPKEKLQLVSELWNDLSAHPENVPLSEDQLLELDRRMEAFRKDPEQVTTWEVIQRRIMGKPLA